LKWVTNLVRHRDRRGKEGEICAEKGRGEELKTQHTEKKEEITMWVRMPPQGGIG